MNSIVIGECSALKLRAKYELTDAYGNLRKSGEEWLIREAGAYLPEVYEEVVKILDPIILDDQKALHLVAVKTFEDIYGVERRAGEEYLITNERSSYHIIDIHEELKQECRITVLDSLQYCVVVNPIDPDTKKNKQGAKLLIKGPKSFFLQPGEELDRGIQNAYLLGENQALLLRASEKVEVNGELQEPGNKWMIHGPCSYVPPVEVEVVELREKIALDKNEAIYVRDTRTGKINVIKGVSYMLQSHEELWEMELPEQVEKLLVSSYFHTNNKRIKHRVVSFRAPFNTAVQVYDFKAQKSRIVFGPDLVTLNPDEVFT